MFGHELQLFQLPSWFTGDFEAIAAFVSRFVAMEGLMQRLERAVTRLELMSAQASSGMANGDCVNGIDGGKSVLKQALGAFSQDKQTSRSFTEFFQVCLSAWRPSTC